jgi:hypothetical protein
VLRCRPVADVLPVVLPAQSVQSYLLDSLFWNSALAALAHI